MFEFLISKDVSAAKTEDAENKSAAMKILIFDLENRFMILNKF